MKIAFHSTALVAGVLATALGMAAPARAQLANLPGHVWADIAQMGPNLNPRIIRESFKLMAPLQASRKGMKVEENVSYGPDRLQAFDVWSPKSHKGLVPVIVYVHGGGFVRGDKNDYDNIPAYFARHGMLAVNMNYRLAPKVTWPAQSEDLGSVVAWLGANAAKRGGDPKRIVVIGHSAGASIVASYVLDPSIKTDRQGVVGAVVISGPFGHTAQRRPRDGIYLGKDPAEMAAREPLAHVNESKLPLMIVQAEYDPVALSPDSHELAAAVCLRDGKCPAFLWLAGHNHITETSSIDTKDDRLGGAIRAFVGKVTKE